MIVCQFLLSQLKIIDERRDRLRPPSKIHDAVQLLDVPVVVDAQRVNEKGLVHRVLQCVGLQIVREKRVGFAGVEEAAGADLNECLAVAHLTTEL